MTALKPMFWVFIAASLWAGEVLSPTGLRSTNPSEPEKVGILRMASGICPQNRKTRRAPKRYRKMNNPLLETGVNLERGRALYNEDAKPTACRLCHGLRGNGNGKLAMPLDPPPRNFTCLENMKHLADGQLFWVIKNGSRGSAMPAHERTLNEREIWQLILYIRGFTR